MAQNKVFIVSGQRTPIGAFQGSLADVPAPQLGAIAIQSAIESAGLQPQHIQECIMGEVLTAGVGQAPARQAAIYAGLPTSVECMTVNKVCGSGLKAVMLAHNAIQLGLADVIVAGGQENMSQAPYLVKKAREGLRLGHQEFTDSLIYDGLWDPYNNMHMGHCGQLCADEKNYNREAQDAFAINSYQKAQKAREQGAFKSEITEVSVKKRKETVIVKEDEEIEKVQYDKIPHLRPAFKKDGTITAGNASKINDGAAALVLMSDHVVREKGIKPIAYILAQASFARDPQWFTLAPSGAIKKALDMAHLQVSDIDLWEINEAFAVQVMAVIDEVKIPRERLNIHGGAIALGHPIGASGARILITLLHAMENLQVRRGLATLCIGGGEASAVIVERV